MLWYFIPTYIWVVLVSTVVYYIVASRYRYIGSNIVLYGNVGITTMSIRWRWGFSLRLRPAVVAVGRTAAYRVCYLHPGVGPCTVSELRSVFHFSFCSRSAVRNCARNSCHDDVFAYSSLSLAVCVFINLTVNKTKKCPSNSYWRIWIIENGFHSARPP